MKRRSAIIALLLLVGTAGSVAAQPYPKVLEACRAAAKAAEPGSTDYRCNWRALVRGAPGAALSGKYALRRAGYTGTMAIIDGGGSIEVAISSVHASSTHTCSLTATATRGADDALVATTGDAPNCRIRIVSTSRNVVRVTPTDCSDLCGVRAVFDGNYRLITR
jgi:hypothetical protein